MDVFWRRGFHDASLPDLLDGMEISRGSFYKAFVDKRCFSQRTRRLHRRRCAQGWRRVAF
ncbi:TetR family transcriptional regulator [Rhizobium laguerreae]|uniref:TetR family transcriptional regulator n=1 Tax=Rhizobium laguerreae TaxID=1076926 RepID=UPI001FECB01C|nr:TetR family transcriptional regulator [Rhizobium laguerreae]